MNKKLLFAAMSLAALTACNSDDFESKNVAQQETSPVVFEVLNNNDAFTRASMNGNKVAWSAEDGDLFTLYHGGTLGTIGTTYQNATFKAEAGEGEVATLTTPSMILSGGAVMVWPVDTTFRAYGKVPSLVIPETLPADVENYIPYVSDEINIAARDGKAVYNSAGYKRVYPIYMRPMASQLNLKAEYVGLDALEALYKDDSEKLPDDGLGGIDPIEVTSVDLIADEGNTPLTKEIPLTFTAPGDINAEITTSADQWKSVAHNAWNKVTDFNKTGAVQTGQLTTKSVENLDQSKFLILPLKDDLTGTEKAGIVVNTSYGKVIVSDKSVGKGITGAQYTAEEIADAWYRYISAATKTAGAGKPGGYDANETVADAAESDGKFKTTANIAVGLKQTLNGFSSYAATSGVVKHEPIGASATRYVKVLLKYLQIDGTHIKTNKQLRDIVLIWNYLGVGDTEVFLDGDKDGNFEISQKTIKLINELNAAAAKEKTPRSFAVKPCKLGDNPGEPKEKCTTIVVTGGGDIQDMAFIKINGAHTADVVFKAGETWKWKGTVTLAPAVETGVKSFINEGTMENAAIATLAIYDNVKPTPSQIKVIPLVNNGTWNITKGDLNVQFDVTNLGIVNISNGAEYHQDGAGNDFTNDATTLPQRFLAKGKEKIGLVNNSGVFACVNGGNINNYGLIEHQTENAKTYITSNNSLKTHGFTNDADFSQPFNPATSGAGNKIGRVNLLYSNKDEENVSISNAENAPGFVSVTISEKAGAPEGGKLDLTEVGDYVNYCIIEGGVKEITKVPAAFQCMEFNAGNTEIAWKVETAKYASLIVFSPVNIQRGTTVRILDKDEIPADLIKGSVYLKAKMYVGGTTNINAAKCNGYFGDTSDNFAKMYLTY